MYGIHGTWKWLRLRSYPGVFQGAVGRRLLVDRQHVEDVSAQFIARFEVPGKAYPERLGQLLREQIFLHVRGGFEVARHACIGQTLYHAALLVERGDLRMLFVGDSHTMAGLDDYCAYNRNWLGRDVGFQYCLTLIEKTRPTHMFNCHVDDAFTFTASERRLPNRKAISRSHFTSRRRHRMAAMWCLSTSNAVTGNCLSLPRQLSKWPGNERLVGTGNGQLVKDWESVTSRSSEMVNIVGNKKTQAGWATNCI